MIRLPFENCAISRLPMPVTGAEQFLAGSTNRISHGRRNSLIRQWIQNTGLHLPVIPACAIREAPA